jgi:hypothetical protein
MLGTLSHPSPPPSPSDRDVSPFGSRDGRGNISHLRTSSSCPASLFSFFVASDASIKIPGSRQDSLVSVQNDEVAQRPHVEHGTRYSQILQV